MRLPLSLILLLPLAHAQTTPTECTADLVVTDDCTDVMNPIACYNQYRWNTRTLSCIEGANDAERKRKVRLGAGRRAHEIPSFERKHLLMEANGGRRASVAVVLGRSCVTGLRHRSTVEEKGGTGSWGMMDLRIAGMDGLVGRKGRK